ncbi:MAG: type II secretion system F family protein [Spirochaetes bacterium]|nr:MAG: type II secretion system F family protein [Spirochaetota bacterium]
MIYEYQALDRKGTAVSDLIDATSDVAARQRLRAQGLYVTSIKPHAVMGTGPSEGGSALRAYYDRLSHYVSLRMSVKEVGIFSRQLATLLNAGMPLLVAITDIIDQIDNQVFKSIIVDIKGKLEEGSSFSNCLERHKVLFSDMFISMVRVGESLGSLDQVMERLADLEEKRTVLKSKINAALWYPAFLVIVSFVVIFLIMIYVIPSLSRLFLDLGKSLPLPTRIVMAVSDFLANYWFIPLTLLITGGYFFNQYRKTPEGRRKMDELKLTLPLVSQLYKKLLVLRFTQNLGILLNNRVDILKSFEIVKKIVVNSVVEERIDEAAKKIREGATVSTALAKSGFLPRLVMGMIAAGEASDTLDTMLVKIGNVYETELDLTISSLTRLIEPIIIVVMGLFIGLLVVSVLLPIFEMNLILQ